MENLIVQRELEDELRKLRIELKLHERRVKSVESKVNKDVEHQGPKRRRDEVSTTDANKRLRSEVSIVTKGDAENKTKAGNEDDDVTVEIVRKPNDLDEENSNKKSAKPEDKEKAEGESPASAKAKAAHRRSSGDKNRDRRLFSSLLQGTLNSFKRSTNQENELKTIQKRKEVEMQIEERVQTEQQHLLHLEKQKLEEEKNSFLHKVEEVKEEIKKKEEKLLNIKFSRHEQLLSSFLKTKSFPSIYFYPSKTDEFTERVLGTKKPLEIPKDVTDTDAVVDAGGKGVEVGLSDGVGVEGEDGDVEVEEITRVKEVGLPIMAQQEEDDLEEGENRKN